jgi:hypothetical protein
LLSRSAILQASSFENEQNQSAGNQDNQRAFLFHMIAQHFTQCLMQ